MEKIVLISGAAGSIGSELTRQIINAGNIKKIVCVDFNETGLFNLSNELSNFEELIRTQLFLSLLLSTH